MRTTAMFFIFILISGACSAQPKSRADCVFVDSFYLTKEGKDKIYVGFEKATAQNPMEESVLLRERNGKDHFYYRVLQCYPCTGYGMPGGTYGGYVKDKNIVVFIQRFSHSIDTVYIDFAKDPPVYKKYIHHSLIDHSDSYRAFATGSIPITAFSPYFGGEKKLGEKFRIVYTSATSR